MRCLACRLLIRVEAIVDGCYCPVCELIYTCGADELPNQRRGAKLNGLTAAAAGSNSSVTSSQLDSASSSSKAKLGAYEAELKRLLDLAGPAVQRVQAVDGIAHGDAIAGVRDNSFIGSAYARQSDHLTQLIRSGHFKELSLALPVTNADAQRRRQAEAKGSKVMLSASGELTSMAETMVERPLVSLQEFLTILIVSILPTLFDRPRAALDWLELARSMIDLTARDGWTGASRYLVDLLSDRVPTGIPFNKFDHTILQSVRSSTPEAGGLFGAPAAGAGGAPPRGDRPAWIDQCTPNTCRDYNLTTCKTGAAACKFRHMCCWIGCPTPQAHKGDVCPLKPAGVTSYTPRADAPPRAGGVNRNVRGRR